jgi:hypothetical protein
MDCVSFSSRHSGALGDVGKDQIAVVAHEMVRLARIRIEHKQIIEPVVVVVTTATAAPP